MKPSIADSTKSMVVLLYYVDGSQNYYGRVEYKELADEIVSVAKWRMIKK